MAARKSTWKIFYVFFAIWLIVVEHVVFSMAFWNFYNKSYSNYPQYDSYCTETTFNVEVNEEISRALNIDACDLIQANADIKCAPCKEDSNNVFYNNSFKSILISLNILLLVPDSLLIMFFVGLFICINKDSNSSRVKRTVFLIVGLVCLTCAVPLMICIKRYIFRQPAIQPVRAHAPVIYVYGDEEDVIVKLDLDGYLTVSYPAYDQAEGWNVVASNDGTLTAKDGSQYRFLFWQADLFFEYDLSKGYCVRGEDTEAFLYMAAGELGLNEVEAADFVRYWLPEMECNAYNVITFQTDNFDEAARLSIKPNPDVILRVNMLWYASDEYVDIEAQDLSAIALPVTERHGLTVIEWGGEKI